MLEGFNDLATLLPDIAAEWSDRNYHLLPTQVTVFANRKVWWKCKDCGKEWNTLISTRSGGSKCPYCSGYKLLRGFNDLATTHPEIASEWSEKNLPFKPDAVNAKSRENVWWKCSKCGNEWKSVINARVKGTVCPVCAEREVLAGYNDLATTDKELLSEWYYELNNLKPTEVSRNSAKRAWWKCKYGHSWSMKINERTVLGKGCRICEKEYLSVFPALAVSYYANKMNKSREELSDYDEKSYSKMKHPMGIGTPKMQNYLFSVQQCIISEIATYDKSCIIVGRCSDYILRHLKNTINIFIYAPYEKRLKNCIEVLGMNENEAKDMIAKVDKARDNYHQYYTGMPAATINGRQIMIDSSFVGVEHTAEMLADMIKKRVAMGFEE